MTYVDRSAPPVNCASGQNPAARRIARRLWRGHNVPVEPVILAARRAASELGSRVGRVESAGGFEDPTFAHLVQRSLPAPLDRFIGPRLEWYGCRGAFFHNDAHYENVLFGVWCVLGPPRELVFPRLGAKVPAAVGDLCVFDPFEPHGVLRPGADTYAGEEYEAADPSLFLGFEIELAPVVCVAFGIDAACPGAPTYSSRIAIHPETGVALISAA